MTDDELDIDRGLDDPVARAEARLHGRGEEVADSKEDNRDTESGTDGVLSALLDSAEDYEIDEQNIEIHDYDRRTLFPNTAWADLPIPSPRTRPSCPYCGGEWISCTWSNIGPGDMETTYTCTDCDRELDDPFRPNTELANSLGHGLHTFGTGETITQTRHMRIDEGHFDNFVPANNGHIETPKLVVETESGSEVMITARGNSLRVERTDSASHRGDTAQGKER